MRLVCITGYCLNLALIVALNIILLTGGGGWRVEGGGVEFVHDFGVM